LLLSVAVPADRDEHPVREFKSFTSDLYSIAEWLKDCNIETVAMECTGIYWKNLYTVLIQYGFDVCLVSRGRSPGLSKSRRTQQRS